MRKLAALAATVVSTGGMLAMAVPAHAGINIGDNWCAAPWSWPGPVSSNDAVFTYDACNDQSNAIGPNSGNGVNVADNWCAAPWDWEGPLSANDAPFTYLSCKNQRNDSPPMG